jgi:hypothetical protein
MRRLLLPLSLLLIASSPYVVHAQGYAPPPPAAYPPGPPPPPPPPPYAGRPGPYASGGPAYSQENCGTPDEPKPCPPMPRVPLQYYPGNRP